ncbi:C-type mannose receptor 2-like isoform X1 [Embiotoca jacksoni]|uniref:C-type mannose receptor 2-like isoform X1 n=1 Tax=Embiotoca jacksoni TaxID=100190 RepID=UPI0037045A65
MTENRLIAMKRTLILISAFGFFTLGSPDFHLINLSRTYTEAKSFCREVYTDLATVHNSADMNNLINLVPATVSRAWIGLEVEDVWLWHWSWSDQTTDFFNWKAGEPQSENQDACAAMNQHGEWFESDCGTKRSFVCHGNVDTSGQIFVAMTKSWRDAQSHCRDLSSDLVSIHSAEEDTAVQNVSEAQNVWIGLFKDPWKWSDGSNSSFRFWKPSQPNYYESQDCVAAVFRDGRGQWNDLKCTTERTFICCGARKPIPTTPNQIITQETVNSRSADESENSQLQTICLKRSS